MSCSSVGSVCRISSFEVAVFQSVCESFFIVQVFAGVTASGTSSSFYHSHFGHLYWKLCLHWAPGLQTKALEKLLVSAAPSSAISHLTHLYFSHVSFLLVSFWLFVCWTFLFIFHTDWFYLIFGSSITWVSPWKAEDNRIIHVTLNNEWSPSVGEGYLCSDW